MPVKPRMWLAFRVARAHWFTGQFLSARSPGPFLQSCSPPCAPAWDYSIPGEGLCNGLCCTSASFPLAHFVSVTRSLQTLTIPLVYQPLPLIWYALWTCKKYFLSCLQSCWESCWEVLVLWSALRDATCSQPPAELWAMENLLFSLTAQQIFQAPCSQIG